MTKDAKDREIAIGDIVRIVELPNGMLDGLSEAEAEFLKSSVGKSAIVDEIVDALSARVFLTDDATGALHFLLFPSKNLAKRPRFEVIERWLPTT
jgi:hypothetical protein